MAIYVRWRFARPRIRRGDESPDGDLALPCPRRAQASPGVASTTSPPLRVPSPRRSRMRPSPHTNGHESLGCALQHLASESLNLTGRAGRTGRTGQLRQQQLLHSPTHNSSTLPPTPWRRRIRVACEAGAFVCGEGRIRILAGGESPQGWMRRVRSREGRLGKWVSHEWVSG